MATVLVYNGREIPLHGFAERIAIVLAANQDRLPGKGTAKIVFDCAGETGCQMTAHRADVFDLRQSIEKLTAK